MGNGKKTWFIADGYLPYKGKVKQSSFEGHEAIMILNCNEVPAHVSMDIYYEDREPIRNINILINSERIKCIRMDHPDETGGIIIERQQQYALRFTSDVDIIVQYGRMDIAQPNLAYIGLIGYAE